MGHVAPFDEVLGLTPHQRTSMELQALGCAFAVFVPFATAARFVSWCSGSPVSPWAVWQWVQAAGAQAMSRLEVQLEGLENGEEPEMEAMAPELTNLHLALSGDGVRVPFRPAGGRPEGKTQWREIKVGVLARLQSYRTRSGKRVTRLAGQSPGGGVGRCRGIQAAVLVRSVASRDSERLPSGVAQRWRTRVLGAL